MKIVEVVLEVLLVVTNVLPKSSLPNTTLSLGDTRG